jgi:hypothetical protein
LWFKDLEEWENWSPNGRFPHLLELYIIRCPKLRKLAIGPLPSLKVLSIAGTDSVTNVGHEFYGKGCSQPFKSLETLHFESMGEWENWSPNGEFPHLRELSIKYCPKLLGQLPNHLPLLKKVLVEECRQLVVSISCFPELCEVEIEGWKGVVRRSKVDFSSLKSNSLSTISEFTCPIEGFIFFVEDLAIEDCEELMPLWSNDVGILQTLPNLRVIRFNNCPKLVSLVTEEVKEQRQLDLSASTLREICISHCNSLESLPNCKNMCVEYINIYGCDSLKRIAIGQLPLTLKRLIIEFCENMLILVDEDDTNSCSNNTSLLEYLSISQCPSLKSLFLSGELPASLKHLRIGSCRKLESIAKSFHHNSSLEKVVIESCENLKSLPVGIHTLSYLDTIEIRCCPALVSFPDGGFLPSNLRDTSLQNLQKLTLLEIGNCNIIEALLKWGLHKLTSLKELEIGGIGCLNVAVSFPDMMLPASLTSLTIKCFHNLKHLSFEGFKNLTSLEVLRINGCENLTSFPKDGLPPSLLRLYINGCPLLKEHCKKDQGREWSTIAHIPCVIIDGRFIYDPEEGNC